MVASRLSRPLRILHVVDVLALAGMEYGVIKLVNRLDPKRFTPMICCLRFQDKITIPMLRDDIRVVEMNKRDGRDWRLVPALRRLMREERIDLVHSHNWPTFLYAVLATRLARSPVLIHGEHGREVEAPPVKRVLVSRFLARFVNHLTTVSDGLARELVERWRIPSDRVTAIANGVELTRSGTAADVERLRDELGLEPAHKVVLTIGRLRPVKGYPTLLRAFAEVHGRLAQARLVVVGTDFGAGVRSELVQMAEELGIEGATFFLGMREDVPALLELADVYVNSSIFEGMSNTILEAMAARRAIVATAVGGNPELVSDGESGYLVPVGDWQAMAERIHELLSRDDLRDVMGARGRERVECDHEMSTMVCRYSNLYTSCFQRDASFTSRRR